MFPPKKAFMCFCFWEKKVQSQTYFDSQFYSSHNQNIDFESSVAEFSEYFTEIFGDFTRIFDKAKLLGVRLHPASLRLPDVLERQELSLNLVSNSLCPWFLKNILLSLKILE